MLNCMATAAIPANDPVELVRQLDPLQIRHRLNDLDRERKALIVLLRASATIKKQRPGEREARRG